MLLIESLTVGDSEWVQKEIVEALSKRIPVRVVSLPDVLPTLTGDAQRVE